MRNPALGADPPGDSALAASANRGSGLPILPRRDRSDPAPTSPRASPS